MAANRGTERKLTRLIRELIRSHEGEKTRNRRAPRPPTASRWTCKRYLAGEPVPAAGELWWYRLRPGGAATRAVWRWPCWGCSSRVAGLRMAGGHAASEAAGVLLETDIGRDLDEARAFCREDRLREASAVLDHACVFGERRSGGRGPRRTRGSAPKRRGHGCPRGGDTRGDSLTKDGHLLDWEDASPLYRCVPRLRIDLAPARAGPLRAPRTRRSGGNWSLPDDRRQRPAATRSVYWPCWSEPMPTRGDSSAMLSEQNPGDAARAGPRGERPGHASGCWPCWGNVAFVGR